MTRTSNDKLFLQTLGFPEFKVIEQNDTTAKLTRKVMGQPKMDLPGPVAKLLGANFRFTEEGTWDKTSKVWTFKMIPKHAGRQAAPEGTMN